MMRPLTHLLQVNIPFAMLSTTHLDRLVADRLNPEIGFDATSLDTCPLSHMESVAGRLHQAGLSITFHAPFMDLSPGSPDPKIRELTQYRLRQLIRLIPLFRPITVVCHTGYDHRRYWHIRNLWLKNSLDIWPEIAEAIQSNGSAMMLENVYEESPDEIMDLLTPLGKYGVGGCLDSGHQAVFGNVSLDTWISTLGPCLGQLHLHDNHGKQDEHLAMGQGTIDFQRLLDLVKTFSSTRPVITLEPHKEEDLLPSLKYLEKIWPW